MTNDGTVMTMPVQPANTAGNGGFGWGGEGSWFIIILFLFAFLGWGGNGMWGGNRGASGSAVDGYILTSDFANIERKIDGVNNGLCDGFYGQAQLINGVQSSMQQGFMTAEISRANQQAAFMQQLNAMQRQQADCCCETREAIQSVRYDMASQACDTRNTVQTATRDIIDNQNQNQGLKMAASQAAQNNYLISQLRPTPIPAYASCNPWAGGTCNGLGGCG